MLFSFQLYPQSRCDTLLIEWSGNRQVPFERRKTTLYFIIHTHQHEKGCLANAYRRLGTLFKNYGRLDSAIQAYVKASELALVAQDTLSQATSLNQVGVVYHELHNNRQAKHYFEKALAVFTSLVHYRGMSDAAINLGEIAYEEHNRSESKAWCLKSLEYMRHGGDTATVGYNYILLSRLWLDGNQILQAKGHAQSAAYLLEKDEDIQGLIPAWIQLANCYRQAQQSDSSQHYLKKSYQLARQYRYKKWIAETAGLLGESFGQQHLSDSALFYIKTSAAYHDSLLNEQITRAAIETATRYDTEKKEMELIHQKELIEDGRLLNYALIALVSLLLITILVLMRSFAQSKKINRKESELQNANAMLRGQDAERERIARELHDRVGSMLSTVKLHFSAMDEQMGELVKAHGESHKKAIMLLDETYEEVRRISHDLDTGLLGRFGLRTAIMQLAQAIESSNKLRIQYIDNDLDSALYKDYETDLYRITQELLSNTIKYAGAKEVSIQLSRNNGNLVYSYEDDGAGFSKEVLLQQRGMGYKNINARVKKMQGTWHLDTSPGNGLNLIIELPIHANTTDHS